MVKLNIQLRALRDSDADDIARLANNKKVWDNVRDKMPYPYARKDAEFFIGLTKKEDPQVTFGIIRGDDFCGVIGLILQSDVYRKSAELGYWIGEPYWGMGIATETVRMILEYGFKKLDFERIFASTFEYNFGSMRVLEKNGFVKEGIAKKEAVKNGVIIDVHRYAIVNPKY